MTHALGDARFHARAPAQPLRAVAAAARGTAPDLDRAFTGVAALHEAGVDEVGLCADRKHLPALAATGAGAVVVSADFVDHVPASAVPIVVERPQAGWARVAKLFHPEPLPTPGVHATAAVDTGAIVDLTAEIGAFATVEHGARIGPGSRIGPYALIGVGVVVGEQCRIGAHCTISHALIGDRVRLAPGVRVGQEGFGLAPTETGYVTIPQLGRVIIEDDVEIGANTTIDRGSVTDTVIGAGSRIDNLVQVAHNVRLGRGCVLAAQVGVSGSTVLGDFVQVGGQAGFAGHLTIGRGVQIGAQAGVIGDLAPGVIVVGSPAMPRQEVFRQIATLKRLSRRPPRDGG